MKPRWLAGLCALVCLLSAEPAATSMIYVTVATDQATYWPGEPIAVSVTGHNPADYPVTLGFGSTLQAQYTVDETYTYPTIGLAILTQVMIPGKGSHTWSFRHMWQDYDLSLGGHSVTGTVIGKGSSDPVGFEIVPAPPVADDLFIDFEVLPDGTPAGGAGGGSLWYDYAAWGVHFGSIGVPHGPSIQGSGGNQYAQANRCSYPPGLNIVADFDMPVFGIAADVSSAAGVTITMIARDSQGQVVDSVVSPPVPAVGEFVGPIQLSTTTPISSVEWWPSNTQASVSVDDVYIVVPEPVVLTVLAAGVLGLIRRRRT